jgi:enoyl-CoA hydratase/carnithine racemase
MQMDFQTISYEKAEGVGRVTLNRPERLNAMNFQMLEEMGSLLEEIVADEEVRVILLTGQGRYFAAGADLEILSTLEPASFRLNQAKYWNRVFCDLEETQKPTIAALNGPAIGGGVELALCCDLRYAVEDATLRFPQIDFGLVPDAGATVRLPWLVGPARAKELILSGEPLGAREAVRMGLVNRVFPQEEFAREVGEIAGKMAKKPPLALGAGKRLINREVRKADITAGLEEVTEAQSLLITTEDYREGVRSFFEKRKPVFRGR